MSKIYVDEIAGIADADTVAIPGHVIQVASTSTDPGSNQYDVSSSSFTNTGFSVAITPTATTSKIVLLLNGGFLDNKSIGRQGLVTIYRGATNLGDSQFGMQTFYSSSSRVQMPFALSHIDEPSSTSAQTYSLYLRGSTADTVGMNPDGGRISFIAMEIAG